MRLTFEGLKNARFWEERHIILPGYDAEQASRQGRANPRWVHFGGGNIFRVFLGSIADSLLERGELDGGVIAVETYDQELIDRIYDPYDNLTLSVILNGDGTRECRVLGSIAEAVRGDPALGPSWDRMKEIFASASLQIVSFTITEKGYSLYREDGTWLNYVLRDIENGPEAATGAMGVLTAMLLWRYRHGAVPLALVSMDNRSQNGAFLRQSVIGMAEAWRDKGYADSGFVSWIADSGKVSFPWTMIDKITPRPSESIAAELERMGIEDMQPIETGKRTYIAPFVNAEKPQYLVIEDSFPNGRPALEKGLGVYLSDRETVDKTEKMKVSACLNPVHSALGPFGVIWGVELFADLLADPVAMKMGKELVYQEGMPMIRDPKILSPEAFARELFEDRFPNRYLGDTNMRLCSEESQGISVRFGVTVKAYMEKYGTAERLRALPLGLAGWLRYLMAVDDEGKPYRLAPDPLAEDWHRALSTVKWGDPASLKDQLRPLLSNETVFLVNMYDAGLGGRIEEMFRQMIAGPGSCRAAFCRIMA